MSSVPLTDLPTPELEALLQVQLDTLLEAEWLAGMKRDDSSVRERHAENAKTLLLTYNTTVAEMMRRARNQPAAEVDVSLPLDHDDTFKNALEQLSQAALSFVASTDLTQVAQLGTLREILRLGLTHYPASRVKTALESAKTELTSYCESVGAGVFDTTIGEIDAALETIRDRGTFAMLPCVALDRRQSEELSRWVAAAIRPLLREADSWPQFPGEDKLIEAAVDGVTLFSVNENLAPVDTIYQSLSEVPDMSQPYGTPELLQALRDVGRRIEHLPASVHATRMGALVHDATFAMQQLQAKGTHFWPQHGHPLMQLRNLAQMEPTHQHVNQGGKYFHLGTGRLQTAMPLEDMAHIEIYVGTDGELWGRRQAEFNDPARFIQVPKPVPDYLRWNGPGAEPASWREEHPLPPEASNT